MMIKPISILQRGIIDLSSRAWHHSSVPAVSWGQCMAHRLLDLPCTNIHEYMYQKIF